MLKHKYINVTSDKGISVKKKVPVDETFERILTKMMYTPGANIELSNDEFKYVVLKLSRGGTGLEFNYKFTKKKDTDNYSSYLFQVPERGITKLIKVIRNHDSNLFENLITNIDMFDKSFKFELIKESILKIRNDSRNLEEFRDKLGDLHETFLKKYDDGTFQKDEKFYIEEVDKTMGNISEAIEKRNNTFDQYKDEEYIDTHEKYYDYNVGFVNISEKDFPVKGEVVFADYIKTKFDKKSVQKLQKYDVLVINEEQKDNFKLFENILIKKAENYSFDKMQVSNQDDLVKMLKGFKEKKFKRVKIIQCAIDDSVWYSEKVGYTFFGKVQGTLGQMYIHGENNWVWNTDCNVSTVKFKGKVEEIKETKTRGVKQPEMSDKESLELIKVVGGDIDMIRETLSGMREKKFKGVSKSDFLRSIDSYIKYSRKL